MPTLIQLSTVQAWNERLNNIYATHDLSYTYVVFDTEHPLSADIKELYNKFQTAYNEEHLSTATKWVISSGELDVGALMKEQTVNNINASLTSMEGKTHYSRTVNTAGTTYSQSTYSGNGTTYGRTTHTAGYTYSDIVCTNVTTYSETTHAAIPSYVQSSDKNSQTCSSQTKDSLSGCTSRFSSRVVNTNVYTYTQYSIPEESYSRVSNTAGTECRGYAVHTATTTYSNVPYGASTTYTRTIHTAGTTYTES